MKKSEFKKENIIIGKIYKKARQFLNITQEQASEYMGFEPGYISDIERGKTKGSIDALVEFCNYYNITPNDVLSHLIYFEIPKQNPDLFKFNQLNKLNQETIITLINHLDQQQNS